MGIISYYDITFSDGGSSFKDGMENIQGRNAVG